MCVSLLISLCIFTVLKCFARVKCYRDKTCYAGSWFRLKPVVITCEMLFVMYGSMLFSGVLGSQMKWVCKYLVCFALERFACLHVYNKILVSGAVCISYVWEIDEPKRSFMLSFLHIYFCWFTVTLYQPPFSTLEGLDKKIKFLQVRYFRYLSPHPLNNIYGN